MLFVVLLVVQSCTASRQVLQFDDGDGRKTVIKFEKPADGPTSVGGSHQETSGGTVKKVELHGDTNGNFGGSGEVRDAKRNKP